MRRSLAGVLAGSLIAVICGCGPKLETVVREHTAPVEAKLAPLGGIREQVMSLPRLAADSVTHAGAPIRMPLAKIDGGDGDASLCYAEDLAMPEELGYVWGRMQPTALLNRCASVLRKGHVAFDPAKPDEYLNRPMGFTADELFKRCEQIKTLLVIRTVDFIEPTQPVDAEAGPPALVGVTDAGILDAGRADAGRADAGRADAGKAAGASSDAGALADASAGSPRPVFASADEDRHVFEGGLIRAEILVFDLASGRYEGGFRVEAASPTRLTGTDVDSDLQAKFRVALNEGIKKFMPGSVLQ